MMTSLLGTQTDARDFPGMRVSRTTYPAGAGYGAHSHHEPHICLVVSGDFVESSERGEDAYAAQSVLIHGGAQPHSNYFQKETTCFNVEFDPSWTKRFGVQLSNQPYSQLKHDIALIDIMTDMKRDCSAGAVFGDAIAMSYGLDALLRIGACIAHRPSRERRWPAEAAARLRREYQKSIDLDALAAQFRLDRAHIARSFHNKMGKTLTAFLHEIRVHRALRMMTQTPSLPLAEIAVESGFADQAHFTRTFKRIMGTPPGAFRRKTKAG
jgi:AraC family transcriptional regulator